MNLMQAPNVGVGGSLHGHRKKEIEELKKSHEERFFKDEKGNTGIVEKVFLGRGRNGHDYRAKVIMDSGVVKYLWFDEIKIY